ncbi:MAG: hypothetical protein H0U27_03635 [Nitrosopumilus sp.]|nr:hypothetical protein [Nitrosopumilus sp.]
MHKDIYIINAKSRFIIPTQVKQYVNVVISSIADIITTISTGDDTIATFVRAGALTSFIYLYKILVIATTTIMNIVEACISQI